MKDTLRFVQNGIKDFDADGEKSLFFYNNPLARIKLFQDLLAYGVARAEGVTNPVDNAKRCGEILHWLDNHFEGNCYTAHEVHFHTNFYQFASCTFTCLTELDDVIEKIIRNNFAA